MLKIQVLNISKKELDRDLEKAVYWDQSFLFKKVYGAKYGQLGDEPYGLLAGDFHFDHSPDDIELLIRVSHIAAAAHAPFITGTSASLLQFENRQDLERVDDPGYFNAVFYL